MNTRRDKVQASTFLGFEKNHLYYNQDNIAAETFFESFETEENECDCDSSYSTTAEKLDSYASDTFKNSTLNCTSTAPSTTTISDSTEDINISNCPICLQVYQEQCYLYPCYHTFCVSCIRQWLYVTPDCPLCKFKVEFLITDVDDSKGTFTKLYINGTTENDMSKMKQQKWISEISNITENNSDIKSIRNKIYSENLFPINVPNLKNKKIFTFNKYDIERVRPFITRDLIVLLSDAYDVVVDEYVFSVILSFYKQKKTKIEITEMLKPWLGKSTEKFINEISQFTESELNIDTWDKLVRYS
jgi:hypothetical protein